MLSEGSPISLRVCAGGLNKLHRRFRLFAKLKFFAFSQQTSQKLNYLQNYLRKLFAEFFFTIKAKVIADGTEKKNFANILAIKKG